MEVKSEQPAGHNDARSSLTAAIDASDLARDATGPVKQAKDAFRSTSVLLTTIRVSFLPTRLVDF